MKHFIQIIICLLFFTSSCKKSDFLNERPQSNTVEPRTLADLQALLDFDLANATTMNTPGIDAVSSDILYIPDGVMANVRTTDRNAYLWNSEIYEGTGSHADWNQPYNQIYKSNIVIDKLPSINDGDQQSKNYIKAQALFYRAYAYFGLSQVFIPYYDSTTADQDLGLPLRLSVDIGRTVSRSSVKKTFEQIFSDLNECSSLMNIAVSSNLANRPCKVSMFALMSRVYLYLGQYVQANNMADSSLKYYNKLIDYNTISLTSNSPFTATNEEVLFYSSMSGTRFPLAFGSSIGSGAIDTTLYKSYDANDIRKSVFYFVSTSGTNNYILRKRDYSANSFPFSGLGEDELYLIKAECLARGGNFIDGMLWLNNLLRTRYKKNGTVSTYSNITAANSADALSKILVERKKQLVFRQRWADLRRLNKEGRNIVLTRISNGSTYTLLANSKLYTLPIPPDEIALSGIQQNDR